MNNYINNIILTTAPMFDVADVAPSTELELFNASTLVVWSGASDNTIFQDKRVNWAFRALHDQLHLKTGFDFSPDSEIELGRIQANLYTGLMADLVYIEVSMQAAFFKKTCQFVKNQLEFDLKQLNNMGWKL